MQTGGRRATLFGILFCLVLIFNLHPVSAQEEFSDSEDFNTIYRPSVPTIDTSQHTGAAVSSIPILVPPGRNGLAPKLALTYNSYRKNGWVGVGWDLDMGAIQRSTKRGVCYTCNDYVATANDSSSELAPRSDWGSNYYGAEIEGDFTRYLYKGGNGWEVTTKGGTKYFYGRNSDSRQDDPNDGDRVFRWCLDRVEDANGNYMTISYEKEPDGPGSYRGQIYLKQIEYTGHANAGPSNSVKFYLTDRPDSRPMLTTYFKVTTTKRLHSIEIRAMNVLARAYRFSYIESDSTLRSLLNTVVQFGSDANIDNDGNITAGSALPATTYNWRNDESNTFTNAYSTTSGIEGYDIGDTRDLAFSFDFNGDGNQDIFFYRPGFGKVGVIRSNGDGTFTNVYLSDSGIAGYDLRNGYDRVFQFDYNGDGLSDLFLYRPGGGVAHIARSNGDGTFTNVYHSGSGIAGYDLRRYNDRAFQFDYNGDGLSDLFLYRPGDGAAYVARSNGDGTFTSKYQSGAGIAGYDLRRNYDRVFPFDFNGDGFSDLFLYRPGDGAAYVARSNGDGTFSRVYNSGYGIAGYDLRKRYDRVFPFDFNGDGLSDLFLYRPGDGPALVARSNGNGSFSNVYFSGYGIAGFDLQKYQDRVVPFDYNGDGLSDLFIYRPGCGAATVARSNGNGSFSAVYAQGCPGSGIGGYNLSSNSDQVLSLDHNGNGKGDLFFYRPGSRKAMVVKSGLTYPDLLTQINNGLGSTTTIAYTPSSHYHNNLLPFIVHPVSSITVDDGIQATADATIIYDYDGGLFDFAKREFRGFQSVTQTNPDNTTEATWFHLDEYLKGRPDKVEFWEYDGGPRISVIDYDWQTADVDDTSKFAYKQSTNTQVFEEDLLSSEKQVDYTYAYYEGVIYLLEQERSTVISGGEGEDVTTSYGYDKYGDWIWRTTQQTITGNVSEIVRETYYDHDDKGNLRFEEHWNNNPNDSTNPVTEREYYSNGNLWKVHDPNSNTPTIYEYDTDTATYPARVTNPLGHVIEYEYDYRYGKVSAEKDANNNWTDYDFDPFGRLEKVEFPDGGRAINEYHDDVFPRYVISRTLEDAGGNTIDAYSYFDGLGRKIQTITLGEGDKTIVTKALYDNMGRNYKSEGPFFSTMIGWPIATPAASSYTEIDFDQRGRPFVVRSPLGQDVEQENDAVTRYTYSGFSTTVEDPDGGKKTETMDYLGRVIQVIEHGNAGEIYTDYDYNAAGNLLAVTNALNHSTVISYDSLGRKINMNDPDMGYWQYTYDANGNLITQTDAKNQTITFGYDPLDRVTSKSYFTADSTVIYTYDDPDIANGIGRLYRVENFQAATTIDSYDEMGRQLSSTRTIIGAPADSYTTAYEYDFSGKIAGMAYPDGYQVDYNYHRSSGLLYEIKGKTDDTEYAEFTSYQPSGKIGELYHGNGVQTIYDYDPESTRLLSIQTLDPNLADLQEKTYRYTAAGDVIKITDTAGDRNITYNYGYDKLHRLVSETSMGGSDNYAPVILDKTFDNTAPVHAVKSIYSAGMEYPYQYDSNGNMTAGWDFTDPDQVASRTIAYNADNMPVEMERTYPGNTPTFAPITATIYLSYDGGGKRVKKEVADGGTTYYIGDHFEVEADTETKYIFGGNLRIARVTSSTSHFYHKDHLGSSTVLTSYPDGTEVETAEYLPFGLTRSHTGTVVSYYKFTDQELDAETGLYNYDARLYDPAVGGFISADTVVPDLYNPQYLNRYAYCLNNPLIYVDPTGHETYGFDLSATVGAISALTGGATVMVDDDLNIGIAFHGGGGGIAGASVISGAAQFQYTNADTIYDAGNGLSLSAGGSVGPITGEVIIGEKYQGYNVGITGGIATPVEAHVVVEESKVYGFNLKNAWDNITGYFDSVFRDDAGREPFDGEEGGGITSDDTGYEYSGDADTDDW